MTTHSRISVLALQALSRRLARLGQRLRSKRAGTAIGVGSFESPIQTTAPVRVPTPTKRPMARRNADRTMLHKMMIFAVAAALSGAVANVAAARGGGGGGHGGGFGGGGFGGVHVGGFGGGFGGSHVGEFGGGFGGSHVGGARGRLWQPPRRLGTRRRLWQPPRRFRTWRSLCRRFPKRPPGDRSWPLRRPLRSGRRAHAANRGQNSYSQQSASSAGLLLHRRLLQSRHQQPLSLPTLRVLPLFGVTSHKVRGRREEANQREQNPVLENLPRRAFLMDNGHAALRVDP